MQLALLYIYFSKEIKVLKLIKVLLQKNRSIVYTASVTDLVLLVLRLLKEDIQGVIDSMELVEP